jgi:hypothetical protein
MRTMLAAILGSSLLLGCAGASAIGPAGADGLPPRLPAGATVPHWDHYCTYPNTAMPTVLETASAEGWELVTVSALPSGLYLMCFKRPHVEAGATAP